MIRKCFHGIKYLCTMALFFVSFPLALILYGRKKYWLISEVAFDARDNGIHFFRYISNNHKEVNALYLISKKNHEFSNVKKIGKTVEPYSYKHMLVFIAAKAKISTAVHGCSPSGYVTKYLLKHHCTGKNIALKHGIFKNLHPNYFKKNAHLDLICCGGKPEFDFISKEFGYSSDVPKYTGLARFDGLHNCALKQEVFIMPTWRRWLDSVKNVDDFKNSEYYNQWFGLLKSIRFLNLLNENDLYVNFYIHPKLNRFKEAFNSTDERIRFVNSVDGESVQKHLKEARVLITDFSSVFFDFAYMLKPTIYFQFDQKQFNQEHYLKGYFDYSQNGFGAICSNIQEVGDELETIIQTEFRLSEPYFSRASDFFTIRDKHNCERIFLEVKKVISK